MDEPRRDEEPPLPVTLVVAPGFSLLALALCLDGLRVANRENVRPAYDWTVASAAGGAVTSSSGPEVASRAIADIAVSPVTILLVSYEPEAACTPALLAWLRRQDRRGGLLGCVDTAALVLGRAGLLRDESIAVHHEAAAGFREELAGARLLDRRFAFEGRRLSSAGGVATLDMLLGLIARTRGEGLARRVAQVMKHTAPAEAPGLPAGGGADPRLARMAVLMQGSLEAPLGLEEIYRRARVEPSTARRLFRRHLGQAPAAYYTGLRLERARTLLRYSHLSVAEIAAATGFADSPSFCRAFKRVFNLPPSRARHDISGR